MKRNVAKKQHEEKGISIDILLLMFALLGVFFLLSLVSHSQNDPSFSNIVFTKYKDVTQNLFGKVGAYTSDALGTAVGTPALLMPFLLFYMTLLLHRYKSDRVKPGRILFILINGIFIIMTLAIFYGLIGGEDVFFATKPAGGAIGVLASAFIASLVGRVGGIILSLGLLLALSMLFFSMSLSEVGKSTKTTAQTILGSFIALFAVIKNKFKKGDKIESDEIDNQVQQVEPEVVLDQDERDAINSIMFTKETEKEPEIADTLLSDYNDVFVPAQQQPSVEEFIEKAPEPVVEDEPIIVREPVKIEEEHIAEEPIILHKQAKVEKKLFASYSLPLNILTDPDRSIKQDSPEELQRQADLLIQKLQDFDVSGKVKAIQPGPVVTMFEVEPAAGTRISKIAGLEKDLALSMSALSIRIIAPIPGTNRIGVEVPNRNRAGVAIKELLQTKEFAANTSPLTVALGKDVTGKPFMSDVKKMPHLLVAGTTGSGKSVGVNTMICSMLYKSSPEQVKFIMIDPKMVELSIYRDIPHLLAPVVTDTKLAPSVLRNVVDEMERRYEKLMEKKVRNIEGYNEMVAKDGSEPEMFYLVVVVDEFADLMMVAGKDVETSITRIAQKARAVGIHLIIATQRPTANVITGLIKANMPARLAFKVAQSNDSRIILDQKGADMLLGYGDSLFIPPGTSDALRIHGAFVSDEEVRNIVECAKEFGEPEYNMEILKDHSEEEASNSPDGEKEDSKYQEALDLVYRKEQASISMIQRDLSIGYNRAAKIFEMMERRGIIEPSTGSSKPRKVIRPRDGDY